MTGFLLFDRFKRWYNKSITKSEWRKNKSSLLLFLAIVFSVFVYGRSVSAAFFGGRIIYPQAVEIMALEAAGNVCYVPGETISIVPIGSPVNTPTSYFIPYYVTPQTHTTVSPGQLIIGRYLGQAVINCQLTYEPFTVTPVYLETIDLFGTSRS